MRPDHHEPDLHTLCPHCYGCYRDAIEQRANRRQATVTAGRAAAETVCTACHGRLEGGEDVVFVRWERVGGPATLAATAPLRGR